MNFSLEVSGGKEMSTISRKSGARSKSNKETNMCAQSCVEHHMLWILFYTVSVVQCEASEVTFVLK